MTELFNITKDEGSIPWQQPAPLHVAMARDAINAFREAQNAKDEDRKPTISEVA